MRKKGTPLIAVGLLLIAAALSLTAYNIWEDKHAGAESQSAMDSLLEAMTTGSAVVDANTVDTITVKPVDAPAQENPEILSVTVPGLHRRSNYIPHNTERPESSAEASSPTQSPAQPAPPAETAEAVSPPTETQPVSDTASRETQPVPDTASAETQPAPNAISAETQPTQPAIPYAQPHRIISVRGRVILRPSTGETAAEPLNELPYIEINGYRYIGYISVPFYNLNLPIMENWSYEHLKIAPCRFYGSQENNDLVLMSHNYGAHFGSMKFAPQGTDVYFTDVKGIKTHYVVSSIETVMPDDVVHMTTGDWDLTLFTCHTGGEARCAIRCIRAES